MGSVAQEGLPYNLKSNIVSIRYVKGEGKVCHEDRRQWIRSRFGHIDESILGRVMDLKDIQWVDLVMDYDVKGKRLTYRMIPNIEDCAERIAEIFRNGAYEMIHNSEIEWHHDAQEIIRKVRTGEWNFYGCYLGQTMIAAESLYIIRGDRTMEWVWGCVDPPYRGLGVWQNIGIYTDRVVEMSGAQVGSVWAVTTHKYSQMSLEAAGYTAMGCFIGKRVYGGADHRYYRHTLIHYAKLYGDARRHLQNWGSMELTEQAKDILRLIRTLGGYD